MEIKELMIDGEKAYELKNDELDVIVSSFGAGIYSLKYHERNMVITPKDYMVYCYSDGYYGKTVGRIAGRIENGVLKFRENMNFLLTEMAILFIVAEKDFHFKNSLEE